jgi:hypothetical protein
MDPLTILAALGPLAVDLGKSLIGRFIQTDGYKPVNVDEYVQMKGGSRLLCASCAPLSP